MCLTQHMSPLQWWSQPQLQSMSPHQLWFNPQYMHLMWLDRILTDTIALTDIITGITKPKEKVEDTQQSFSVTKRNNSYVIINQNDQVVYHPPHFIKKHIHTSEQLERLAQKFIEKNTNDIESIMEFESSLR